MQITNEGIYCKLQRLPTVSNTKLYPSHYQPSCLASLNLYSF